MLKNHPSKYINNVKKALKAEMKSLDASMKSLFVIKLYCTESAVIIAFLFGKKKVLVVASVS